MPLLHKINYSSIKLFIWVTDMQDIEKKKETRANNNSQYTMVQKKYVTLYREEFKSS